MPNHLLKCRNDGPILFSIESKKALVGYVPRRFFYVKGSELKPGDGGRGTSAFTGWIVFMPVHGFFQTFLKIILRLKFKPVEKFS